MHVIYTHMHLVYMHLFVKHNLLTNTFIHNSLNLFDLLCFVFVFKKQHLLTVWCILIINLHSPFAFKFMSIRFAFKDFASAVTKSTRSKKHSNLNYIFMDVKVKKSTSVHTLAKRMARWVVWDVPLFKNGYRLIIRNYILRMIQFRMSRTHSLSLSVKIEDDILT